MAKRMCPFCHMKRRNVLYHLCWLCAMIDRPNNLSWMLNTDLNENIKFLEELQIKIDSNFP